MADPTPAVLIVNPQAGARRFVRQGAPTWRLDALLRAFAAREPELVVRYTSVPGEATTFARQAAREGASAVWVLGGDGTLREAAAGLLGGATPLGILPGGTVNVLGRSLGHPSEATTALGALLARERPRVRPLDVGLCRDGEGGERPFLMMISRGLDARALCGLSPALKARYGRGAIVAQSLREWLLRAEPRFDVELPEESRRASFLAACNIPLYGGSYVLAPRASPFDGFLDVVGLERAGRVATLGLALSLVTRKAGTWSGLFRRRTPSLRFPGTGPALVQLDGDGFELPLPIEITIAHQRLGLLSP